MKHNAQMYTFLKQREKLFDGLMACLKDEDPNVRKVGETYFYSNCGTLKDPDCYSPITSVLKWM